MLFLVLLCHIENVICKHKISNTYSHLFCELVHSFLTLTFRHRIQLKLIFTFSCKAMIAYFTYGYPLTFGVIC